MSKYDDLFDETAPSDSVFADKGALDPLAEPDEIIARDEQERELATILNGVNEGYLPPTVSIHGPPGTGKTLTTRRVAEEFAARTDALAVEYVNLKECRTIFSAANEIHLELTGERKKSYEGLDGVFEGIWIALEAYPQYTVLILDEIADRGALGVLGAHSAKKEITEGRIRETLEWVDERDIEVMTLREAIERFAH